MLDGAVVLPVGARFVRDLLKAVSVPTRTAVIFPSCIVFVLFHKGTTSCKLGAGGRNCYESTTEYFDPFELVLRTSFFTVCGDTGLKILGMWLKT